MKIEEAKNILHAIVEWQMVCMGAKKQCEINAIDLRRYTLEECLNASRKIALQNRMAQEKQIGEPVKLPLGIRPTIKSIVAVYAYLTIFGREIFKKL